MQNSGWERIYDNFKLYYPQFESQVIDWYPSGRNSIIVVLKDGSTFEYHDRLSSIKYIPIKDDARGIEEDEWRKRFSSNLIVKMEDSGFDQTYLAEQCGVSRAMINRYVHRKATPNGWVIEKIARALKCSITELIKG